MLAPLGPTYTLGCTAQRNGLQPFSFLHLFLAVPKGVGFKKNDTLRSRKNRGELPTGGWSESFDLGLWTQWSHFICEVKTLASGCVLLTSRKTLGLYRDWTAREVGRDLRGLLGG